MAHISKPDLLGEIQPWLLSSAMYAEQTADEIPTIWVPAQDLKTLCDVLRFKINQPFDFLFDFK